MDGWNGWMDGWMDGWILYIRGRVIYTYVNNMYPHIQNFLFAQHCIPKLYP